MLSSTNFSEILFHVFQPTTNHLVPSLFLLSRAPAHTHTTNPSFYPYIRHSHEIMHHALLPLAVPQATKSWMVAQEQAHNNNNNNTTTTTQQQQEQAHTNRSLWLQSICTQSSLTEEAILDIESAAVAASATATLCIPCAVSCTPSQAGGSPAPSWQSSLRPSPALTCRESNHVIEGIT